MNFIKSNIHWLIAGACALLVLGGAMRPPKDEGRVDLRQFRQLPVVDRGRVKPVDTAARTALRSITSEDTFTDNADRERSALEWFLEVAGAEDVNTSTVSKYKFFRITNDQVLAMLELKPRKGFRYSLEEFRGKWDQIFDEAIRVKDLQKEGRELDVFDRDVLKLKENLEEFMSVARHQTPLVVPPSGETEWQSLAQVAELLVDSVPAEDVQEKRLSILLTILKHDRLLGEDFGQLNEEQRDMRIRQVLRDLNANQKRELFGRLQAEMSRVAVASLTKDTPSTPFEQAMVSEMTQKVPAAKAWTDMLKAYRHSDKERFAVALNEYRQAQGAATAQDTTKARVEEWFNRASLFYWCTGLYMAGAILVCLSWMGWTRPLLRAADTLILITFIVHFVGLSVRMYLQGRPPVTNLYSSAIFIGLGCVYMGMLLERFWPIGVGNLVGATLGFLTTIVAHGLGADRDTLEMMQAVLDTNFWLATHVTIVTTGYMATFVAGFIGIVFIVRGLFTPSLDDKAFKALSQMLYGVICFATFASFTGTVLGGIWADQSWGRFWGWDSKENGAVLVVIWNTIILHARWAGLVKQRGVAVLAVAGNIVTGWSWFGTNMLGVGLHSYGFMDTVRPLLVGFWFSQAVVIALGLIPTYGWRSFGQPLQPILADGPVVRARRPR